MAANSKWKYTHTHTQRVNSEEHTHTHPACVCVFLAVQDMRTSLQLKFEQFFCLVKMRKMNWNQHDSTSTQFDSSAVDHR